MQGNMVFPRWRWALSEFMRPLMMRLPRGQHFLYSRICGKGRQYDDFWRSIPNRYRVFFDKAVDAYVYADVGDWSGRHHYFCGGYRDPANGLLIKKCLRAGDTYIDVGANYGIFSILASRIVGPEGRVISFEPNPQVHRVLQAMLAINHISNCEAMNVGLSDAAGSLTLSGADEHTGTFTLREVEAAAQSMQVQVLRGDDIFARMELKGRVLVKIDTEGFEHHVLRGLDSTLAKYPRLAVCVEVTDAWLKQTGSSAVELFKYFSERGFKPYEFKLRRRLMRRELELAPLDGPRGEYQYDVLFMRDGYLSQD
jgi:FkbM family methyltransferase